MTEIEEMILEDAIRTAIKTDLKLEKMKRAIVPGIVLITSLGIIIGLALGGIIWGV